MIIDAEQQSIIFYISPSVSVNFINIIFQNGYSITGMGGDIYNNWGNCKVNNCTFINNYAYYGGAIYNTGNINSTVTNCTFINNSAFYSGGAIQNQECNNSTVCSSSFINNSAGYGGAIHSILVFYIGIIIIY